MIPQHFIDTVVKVACLPANLARIYSHVDFSNSEARGACQRGGTNATAFKVWLDSGNYKCWRCGDGGSLFSWLNGGERPTGKRFVEVLVALCQMIGVDTAPLDLDHNPVEPIKFDLPKILLKRPKPPKPVIDRTKEYDASLGKATTNAIAYMKERIPATEEDLEIMVELDQCVLAPSLVPDDGSSGGTFRRAKDEGYELATPLFSVEKHGAIVGAALRNVVPEKKPKDKAKALNSLGSYGGEYGSTMGRLDLALHNAQHHKKIVICEGILDYLTLRTCFINYTVGVAGVQGIKKLVRYIAEIACFEGQIVCCIDNDDGSDRAFVMAAREARKLGVEFLDGRPKKRGQDLNDVFVEAGGYSDGSRAIHNLISEAKPYHYDSELDRELDGKRIITQEQEEEAKEKTEIFFTEYHKKVKHQAEEKARLKRDKNKRIKFSGVSKKLKLIHLEYGAKITTKIAQMMLFERSQLGASAVFKIFNQAGIKGYRQIVDQAIKDPITNKSPQSIIHWIIQNTKHSELLQLFVELARALVTPLAPYLRGLGFFHGVDRQDKGFIAAITNDEADGFKKLSAYGGCGSYYREYVPLGLDFEDSANADQVYGMVCNNSLCGHCYGCYIAEQQQFEDHSSWYGKFIVGFARASEDTPGSAVQTWRAKVSELGSLPVRGVLIPESQALGFEAGVLFVARLTSESRQLFNTHLHEVNELDSFEALDLFCLAQLVLPMSVAARTIRRDMSLELYPWIGRVQLGRYRNAPDFSWASLRVWKTARAGLREPREDSPKIVSTYHADSKILVDRRSTDDPDKDHLLQQWEILSIADKNNQLQEWLDDEFRLKLPGEIGDVLVAKRRKWRERINAAREAREAREAVKSSSESFSANRYDFAPAPT